MTDVSAEHSVYSTYQHSTGYTPIKKLIEFALDSNMVLGGVVRTI